MYDMNSGGFLIDMYDMNSAWRVPNRHVYDMNSGGYWVLWVERTRV